MEIWLTIRIQCGHVNVLLLLLVTFLRFSGGNICQDDSAVTMADPCAQGLEMSDHTTLKCEYTDCNPFLPGPQECRKLKLTKAYSLALIAFNATQCETKGASTFLGFTFSWSINRSSELTKILVAVRDNSGVRLLDIDLPQSPSMESFSTGCVPFANRAMPFTILAKAGNEGFSHKLQRNITFNCDEIYVQQHSLCPAMPLTRPVAHAFCNRTVSVEYTSEPPPGIGDSRSYFLKIRLYMGKEPKYNLQLKRNATVGNAGNPSCQFENVTVGTYNAKFAYLDESQLPCGDVLYSSRTNVTVEDPPEVKFKMGGHCDGTITVHLNTSKAPVDRSVYNSGKLYLHESSTHNVIGSSIVSTRETQQIHKEEFSNVAAGSYYAKFVFLDEEDTQCNDGAVYTSEKYQHKVCKNFSIMAVSMAFGCTILVLLLSFGFAAARKSSHVYRVQRMDSTTPMKEDDSITGMVIHGDVTSVVSQERKANNVYVNGSLSWSPLPFHTQNKRVFPDSGLPPSVCDVPSLHDGRSATIKI